jgi:ferric-dicitrate binding protein FerR (iron transport regulator)
MNRDDNDTDRDHLVERLLRLADDGPEIPPDGADRIKAAVRPLWRRQLRERARRRWLWSGGLAAAAALVLAVTLSLLQPEPASVVAAVDAIDGAVEITPPSGSPHSLTADEIGASVAAGSWIRTDDRSRIALRLAGGQSLRLDRATSLRLGSPLEVELDRGGLYLDSEGAGGEGLEVLTALGLVHEIGTQFEVRRDDGPVVVRVREGAVSFTRRHARLEVAAGAAVEIAVDGTMKRRPLAVSGPEWSWVLEIAPAFEIEGRRVVDFLDWVAGETGWSVAYSSPVVEEFAAATLLHGSLGELGPAEAPDVVLASCGLKASRQAGALVISRVSEPGRPPP